MKRIDLRAKRLPIRDCAAEVWFPRAECSEGERSCNEDGAEEQGGASLADAEKGQCRLNGFAGLPVPSPIKGFRSWPLPAFVSRFALVY